MKQPNYRTTGAIVILIFIAFAVVSLLQGNLPAALGIVSAFFAGAMVMSFSVKMNTGKWPHELRREPFKGANIAELKKRLGKIEVNHDPVDAMRDRTITELAVLGNVTRDTATEWFDEYGDLALDYLKYGGDPSRLSAISPREIVIEMEYAKASGWIKPETPK